MCSSPNGFNDSIQIAQYLFIGESENFESLRFEPSIANSVIALPRREIVTFTIELNDESRRVTDEVGHISLHRCLSPEPQATDPVRLEIAP